jgi:uncharacterized membrane protein YczE
VLIFAVKKVGFEIRILKLRSKTYFFQRRPSNILYFVIFHVVFAVLSFLSIFFGSFIFGTIHFIVSCYLVAFGLSFYLSMKEEEGSANNIGTV